jgi:hypothetical protein
LQDEADLKVKARKTEDEKKAKEEEAERSERQKLE